MRKAVEIQTFAYGSDMQLEYEETTGLVAKRISRNYDSLGRNAGFSIGTEADPDADAAVAYGYGTDGRFASVSDGTDAFSYSYVANSSLLQTVTYPHGITATRTYETNRNLIDAVENRVDTVTVSKYDYANDTVGRRTAVQKTGTAFTQSDSVTWSYNDRSEVTGADAAQDTAYDYTYAYDPIGNRKTASEAGTSTTYTANQLNQYTAVSAMTDPVHDPDGNMTLMPGASGDWALTWNAENRLIRAEQIAVAPAVSRALACTYDYMGRRVERKVYSSTDAGQNWVLDSHHLYVYDGWNLILVLDGAAGNAVLKTYTWGLDLSRSLQGAGGVGGLLSVTDSTGTYYAVYDANGNVSEYIDGTGVVSAHYDYSPFGGTYARSGTKADDFQFRFSTKLLDPHTQLYYYGHRYYSPELGRWVSRDPMEEKGGIALYVVLENNAVDRWDYLGLYGEHLTRDEAKRLACTIKWYLRYARPGIWAVGWAWDFADRPLTARQLSHFMSKAGTAVFIPPSYFVNHPAIRQANQEAAAHFASGATTPYEPAKAISFPGNRDLPRALGRVRVKYVKSPITGNIIGFFPTEEYTFLDTKEQESKGVPFFFGWPAFRFCGFCPPGGLVKDKWMGDLETYGFAKKFKVNTFWVVPPSP